MTTNTKLPANIKQFTFQIKIALAELKLTYNELVIENIFGIPCLNFVNEGIYQALAGALFMKPGMVSISIVSSRT